MNGHEELVEMLQSHGKVDIDVDDEQQDLVLEDQRRPPSNSVFLSQAKQKINRTSVHLLKLLPSPILNLLYPPLYNEPKSEPRSTAWLDGIRGCAALVVFFMHLSLSVQDSHAMLRAYGSPGAISLWQLPIIRLLYDGSPMVPIFYVTSGCALSLKPVSLIRKDEWADFSTTVSSATFRRGFRLFLPSAGVSFLAMLFTQMGIYNHPYPFLEGNAIIIDRPQRLPNIAAQYVDWLNWVTTQLFYSEDLFQPLSGTTISNYGFQLWTISTEFYASIALFIALVGLSRLAVSIRQVLVFCLCAFAFYVDRWEIACFMVGMGITELSIRPKDHEPASLPLFARGKALSSWLLRSRQYMFALLFILGLFIASYPYKEASDNFVYRPFSAVIDNARFWESMGAICILVSASQLKYLQKLLTSAIPRYLGRISYGVYLTHVVFLNAVGWRIVPWIWMITGDEGWLHRQGGFAVGLLICLILLVWIADIWTRAVDEPCVRLAKRIERWATSRET
jgi:peptidoglycan/LPS O-acetylase OafA/YrhL